MDEQKPQGRNDGHEFDYSLITDKIYIGSDLCKGGVCKIHGEEFKALGVKHEINLSQENNELPPNDISAYLWLPVVDGHPPSTEQLKMGVCFMDSVLAIDQKVYVHCRNGHGRSPTMVAAYLIANEGHTVESAISLISEKRPEAHIEDSQKQALKEFEKTCK